MRKTIIFTAILAGILAFSACKKDETTTSLPSLEGLSVSQAIPYVAVGENLVFKAKTTNLYTSDNSTPEAIGLFWQVNSARRDTLTTDIKKENPEYTYHIDTLGNYQLTCYAYANGYYNASVVTAFQAIDPAKALTGLGKFNTAIINGKEWISSNLNSEGAGVSYMKATVVDPLFGRLYTWEEASTACPSGWHLPSAEEWDAIDKTAGDLMAPAKFLDEDMWKPALGQAITNSTNFNAIPVGYLDNTASVNSFRRHGEIAAFWTSSEAASDPSLAQFRYIIYDSNEIMKGSGDKTSLALSVRCVKN
ncbi:MAG: fibrobacter succinogenes major paralogous domain-containing protein [Bacteroidales bacterium]|nr:fibrobacter succinogenes major paralogous domain-containing protein [Bacteroidales bacterium]